MAKINRVFGKFRCSNLNHWIKATFTRVEFEPGGWLLITVCYSQSYEALTLWKLENRLSINWLICLFMLSLHQNGAGDCLSEAWWESTSSLGNSLGKSGWRRLKTCTVISSHASKAYFGDSALYGWIFDYISYTLYIQSETRLSGNHRFFKNWLFQAAQKVLLTCPCIYLEEQNRFRPSVIKSKSNSD